MAKRSKKTKGRTARKPEAKPKPQIKKPAMKVRVWGDGVPSHPEVWTGTSPGGEEIIKTPAEIEKEFMESSISASRI